MLSNETQNSESVIDDLSSLGQDLISTMLGEKYDSVRECLESEEIEKPQKFCSLAQFVEGNDIARQSFKKNTKNTKMDQEVSIEILQFIGLLRLNIRNLFLINREYLNTKKMA